MATRSQDRSPMKLSPELFLTKSNFSYQLRASGVGRKISSTVNTQLSFSFSTRPLTVNSQQSTIIPVQPELISHTRLRASSDRLRPRVLTLGLLIIDR